MRLTREFSRASQWEPFLGSQSAVPQVFYRTENRGYYLLKVVDSLETLPRRRLFRECTSQNFALENCRHLHIRLNRHGACNRPLVLMTDSVGLCQYLFGHQKYVGRSSLTKGIDNCPTIRLYGLKPYFQVQSMLSVTGSSH